MAAAETQRRVHAQQAFRGRHRLRQLAFDIVDVGLWDIKGKALKTPVWRLLGGSDPQVYAYASGGYYEEGESPLKVIDEMASYVDMGYTAVKMKCGGTELKGDIDGALAKKFAA